MLVSYSFYVIVELKKIGGKCKQTFHKPKKNVNVWDSALLQ